MKALQYIVILFFLTAPFSARAALVVNEFVPELIWTNSCQLTLEYFLEIEPSSIVPSTATGAGHNYFVAIVPEVNGQLQSNQGYDHPINIPANGILENQTINLVAFGAGEYQIKIVETEVNQTFVGQYNVNNLAITACEQGQQNNTGTTSNTGATQPVNQEVPIENPISVSSIPDLVNRVLEIVIRVGIPLLVIMIIYSGALYILARGNTDKLKNAHDALLYTLIGGAILLGAWALAELIQSTLLDLTAFVFSFFV
jgi:hypothetical protein